MHYLEKEYVFKLNKIFNLVNGLKKLLDEPVKSTVGGRFWGQITTQLTENEVLALVRQIRDTAMQIQIGFNELINELFSIELNREQKNKMKEKMKEIIPVIKKIEFNGEKYAQYANISLNGTDIKKFIESMKQNSQQFLKMLETHAGMGNRVVKTLQTKVTNMRKLSREKKQRNLPTGNSIVPKWVESKWN